MPAVCRLAASSLACTVLALPLALASCAPTSGERAAETGSAASAGDAAASTGDARTLAAPALVDAGGPSETSALDAAGRPSFTDGEASRDAQQSVDGTATLPAQQETSGACTTPATSCDGSCVDTRVDDRHCGGCALLCPAGFGCHDSVCAAEVGCSDGTREALTSLARYPTLAGCAATWPLSSMRALPTGGVCGDAASTCAVPADACAAGWHVCGNPGGPEDLSTRITQLECYAIEGRWAAALGDHSCIECGPSSSGAVCCGKGCVQQQGSCVWPDATGWFGAVDGFINRCGAIANGDATASTGVLCCRS